MQNGLPDSPRSGRSQGGSDSSGKPSSDSSSGIQDERGPHQQVLGPLPTLHEDSELSYPPAEHNKPVPLTLKALMATKDDRMNVEMRPHITSAYSG